MVIGDWKNQGEDEQYYATDGEGIRSADLFRQGGEGDNTERHDSEWHHDNAHHPASHFRSDIGLQQCHAQGHKQRIGKTDD